MKQCILYSGGIDSYILKEYLEYTRSDDSIDYLYFDYHGRYNKNEIEKFQNLDFRIIINNGLNLGKLETHTGFIPNRNILFATMANSSGYDKIWIGGSLSDRIMDNNKKVFDELSDYLTRINQRVCIIDSPFWNCYKEDMLAWFCRKNQIESIKELLANTFSCYYPFSSEIEVLAENTNTPEGFFTYNTKECGSCSACFRKCAALYSQGVYIACNNRELVMEYKYEFENQIEKTKRSINTLNYIDYYETAIKR